jgi:hypothetical protein
MHMYVRVKNTLTLSLLSLGAGSKRPYVQLLGSNTDSTTAPKKRKGKKVHCM